MKLSRPSISAIHVGLLMLLTSILLITTATGQGIVGYPGYRTGVSVWQNVDQVPAFWFCQIVDLGTVDINGPPHRYHGEIFCAEGISMLYKHDFEQCDSAYKIMNNNIGYNDKIEFSLYEPNTLSPSPTTLDPQPYQPETYNPSFYNVAPFGPPTLPVYQPYDLLQWNTFECSNVNVTFTIYRDGELLDPNEIFIGEDGENPESNPFTLPGHGNGISTH